ncbi:MAG: phosphatase PAP2 family protein [Thermoleophilia bacterium]
MARTRRIRGDVTSAPPGTPPAGGPLRALDALDRRVGRRLRETSAAMPAAHTALVAAGEVLSPVFRLGVAVLMARRDTRRLGTAALAASVAAAMLGRVLRERLGRPRPGDREEGGFPSRHAAAATAIATVVCAWPGPLATATRVAAATGLAGRVVSAQHHPGDIAGGAALGWVAGRVIRRLAGIPHGGSAGYGARNGR